MVVNIYCSIILYAAHYVLAACAVRPHVLLYARVHGRAREYLTASYVLNYNPKIIFYMKILPNLYFVLAFLLRSLNSHIYSSCDFSVMWSLELTPIICVGPVVEIINRKTNVSFDLDSESNEAKKVSYM